MKISKHFDEHEVYITAQRGIDNTPPTNIMITAKYTAYLLERMRMILGNNPIKVLSWYRCPELNKLIGGSPTSEHMSGNAVDFICPQFGSPRSVCIALYSEMKSLNINQLIYEGNWVHISFAIPPTLPKLQALTYDKRTRKYLPGIVALNRIGD